MESIQEKADPIKKISGKGKGIAAFRRNTRAAVRGLWTGALNKNQAFDAFTLAIEQAIDLAWTEGAAECGIQSDEFTEEEIKSRDDFIFGQTGQLRPFIDEIEKKSKKNKGELTPLLVRNEMWVNQYSSAKQQSEALACRNEKREWRVGRTEHCRTCLSLNGQVRRLSFWNNNVLPRNAPNDRLICGGWRCQCILRKTSKPISRGRLPLGL